MSGIDPTILISVILAIAGWIFTHISKNRHEIFRVRLEKRMYLFSEIFEALADAKSKLERNANKEQWQPTLERLSKARTSLKLYGYDHEIKSFENLITYLERADTDNFVSQFNNTVELMRDQLRSELAFDRKLPIATQASADQ